MLRAFCIFLMAIQGGFAGRTEPLVRGLSVYSGENETALPVLVRKHVDRDGKPTSRNGYITIQFDVLADAPPDLKIRFYHCNRDWKEDDNLFVNDNNHNSSFILNFITSPGGVKGYSYRYVNRFPDTDDVVRFDYSGNWRFKIMNTGETTIFEEGRFIVVDDIVVTKVLVENDYLTKNSSPYNQIQKIITRVMLPEEADGYFFTTVDIVQNRKFLQPYRVDTWDRDPYTHVDGLNTGERIFTIANIMPGNDYRQLDLGNVTRYPNGSIVRNVNGADQLRLFWRTGRDRNGEALRNNFSGLNSDYLEVMFRLDMTGSDYRSVTGGGREIFVAGEFNFWNPALNDKLIRNDAEGSYVVQKFLRRGEYDYQYVTGVWNDKNKTVGEQDWLVLEGNDWRTTNNYTVFVYYNDVRFGGFDRIVGVGYGRSAQSFPGSN